MDGTQQMKFLYFTESFVFFHMVFNSTQGSVNHTFLFQVVSSISYKNILIRRKESDTYLATVRRHCWSLQVAMKEYKICSFQPALWPSSAEESLPFIYLHSDLSTPAMSTDSSQVGVPLFPSY